MSLHIALVEPNNYHGEVLPPLAYLLSELGHKVTVFVTPFIASQNPFVNLTTLDVEVREFEGQPVVLADYDLVVWSSIEPERNIPLFRSIKKPSLAVVHDGSRILSDPYKEILKSSNVSPIVLSKHFSTYLKKQGIENSQIFPSYFHDGNKFGKKGSNIFCVQGKVEFKRRNYSSIINASARLEKKLTSSDFKVMLLGKNNSVEGYLLRLKVLISTGRKRFEVAGVQPDYKDFYDHLLNSEFICPLIDRSSNRYDGYFVDTSSSSIPMGLGHGLIPLLQSEFAALYGLQESSITYEDGKLAEAMEKAVTMGNDQRDDIRAKLTSYREKELDRSLEELKKGIRKVLS